MIKTSKITIFLIVLLFLALPLVIHAKNEGGKQQNRCENRKNMINNRIKMFGVSEKFHKEKYSRIYDRLSNLIERLDTQEINTTKLKSDLETLKGKIDMLKANYDILMSKLEALKEVDCENAVSDKTSMDEIRELLKELKDNANDIREFFINTIKPDLKELREDK